MDTLITLAHLWQNRPSPYAQADEVAQWYTAKSALHRELAAEAIGAEQVAIELGYADTATAHAARLRKIGA